MLDREMPEVVELVCAADLAEVDQPAVLVTVGENVRQIQIAVCKPSGSAGGASDQLPGARLNEDYVLTCEHPALA